MQVHSPLRYQSYLCFLILFLELSSFLFKILQWLPVVLRNKIWIRIYNVYLSTCISSHSFIFISSSGLFVSFFRMLFPLSETFFVRCFCTSCWLLSLTCQFLRGAFLESTYYPKLHPLLILYYKALYSVFEMCHILIFYCVLPSNTVFRA